jgi:hypothetical protein
MGAYGRRPHHSATAKQYCPSSSTVARRHTPEHAAATSDPRIPRCRSLLRSDTATWNRVAPCRSETMGTTFRFLSSPREAHAVLDWFWQLPDPPTPYPKPAGTLLHFGSLGLLSYCPDKTVDIRKSPLVTVVLPQVRRGSLWTVGEVHFLPLARTFPPLDRVSKRFRIWLAQFAIGLFACEGLRIPSGLFSGRKHSQPHGRHLRPARGNAGLE